MKLTRQEHEQIARQILTYHIWCENSTSKITVCHFVKQGIPRRTIYDVLKCYDERKTTNFLPKSGRPLRLSNKDVQALVKSVNNKTGIKKRRRARRFGVYQSTISRTLTHKTTVKIYTRKSAPKYRNENQKKRAQLNCWKLDKVSKPHIQLILDDEKCFSLTGDISCNRKYHTTDSFIAPPEVKYKTKMKFEPKLLVWMTVSQKDVSSIYVDHSAIPIKQKMYLNECIRK